MLRGNTFFPFFLPKSKRTPVRPYFKRVVFGRFQISRALVSTKHLQASYLMDFSTENGMLRGNTFFPFFFHLSPNSHRSGRISNESYSAVFKYFDLQFPPSTNCEGAGRIPDASVLHCQVVGTKFSIRNLGPYLRCLLRFYLEDCHSDDSGVRARTRAGPRAEIYERPVLVRF